MQTVSNLRLRSGGARGEGARRGHEGNVKAGVEPQERTRWLLQELEEHSAGADADAKPEGLQGCKVVSSFSEGGGKWEGWRFS